MAVCAVQGASGLELTTVQPGGPCAGVVLLEPVDLPPNPFFLSPEDGALVASAVASVWIAAFAIRAVIAVVRGPRDE